MTTIKISLNNSAGELDATTVTIAGDTDMAVTVALIELVEHTPLGDGDTITIREVER